MNQSDLICICGHRFNSHYGRLADGQSRGDVLASFDKQCAASVEKRHNGVYYVFCDCRSFKLDNLSYLERKYNETR